VSGLRGREEELRMEEIHTLTFSHRDEIRKQEGMQLKSTMSSMLKR